VSGFVQIIETHTTRADDMLRLEAKWAKDTEGRRTLRRSIVTRDRNDPTRHLIIAFFDDADSAAVNSALPETQWIATELAALSSSEIGFTDLDVISERI
jgi:hypothetical protein